MISPKFFKPTPQDKKDVKQVFHGNDTHRNSVPYSGAELAFAFSKAAIEKQSDNEKPRVNFNS